MVQDGADDNLPLTLVTVMNHGPHNVVSQISNYDFLWRESVLVLKNTLTKLPVGQTNEGYIPIELHELKMATLVIPLDDPYPWDGFCLH